MSAAHHAHWPVKSLRAGNVSDPSCLCPPGPAPALLDHVWLNEGRKGPLRQREGGWPAGVALCLPSPMASQAPSPGLGVVAVRGTGRFH